MRNQNCRLSFGKEASCLFERIERQSYAFCNIAQKSVALLEEFIANQASLHLVYKVTERVYYVTLTSPPVADNMQYAPQATPADLCAIVHNAQLCHAIRPNKQGAISKCE